MQISEQSAAVLEWPQFLQLFSGYTTSPAARERAHSIAPVENLLEELELTRDALFCAQKGALPSLSGLENVEVLIQKSAIENHVAEGIDLYRIGRLASINNEIRNTGAGWSKEFPRLYAACSRLPDLRTMEAEIVSKIEPTGEVKEDATPELVRVIKQTLQLQSRVENALERFFRDSRYRSALQEDYVTYRHGRAVLLVRSEEKNAIRGVVHGESGSGASLFVEPLSVLELNNELAQLADRQSEEIRKILKELTLLTAQNVDPLLFSLQQLIQLDLVLARGRFGKAFDCIVPEFSQEFSFSLRETRHPLLMATLQKQNRPVVPLSMELPAGKKALVVTGPNTGGKTVFLKTAGLISLMAHCGLPVPAAEGTRLPALNTIQADIGDQQSISESLSTFSSHIRSLVVILSNVQSRSLILLDELGTGTDPEEGAHLGVAVLEELLKRDVKVLVTSHHSAMKMFAFNHPACLTAAMEFDAENLLPTYRVLLDQIGASHALEIAGRLGIPEPVLERARGMTDEDLRRVQDFQKSLQEKIRILEKNQDLLSKEKAEWTETAELQRQRLGELQLKLEEQRTKLRTQNVDLIRTLNARVENLLSRIRDSQIRQQIRKQYEAEIAPVIQQLQETTTSSAPQIAASDLQPGDRVWVELYKDFGEFLSAKKDQAEVLIRNKRFVVPLNQLEKKESIAKTLPKGIQLHTEKKDVPRELNVIGQTVEEALGNVDKYLDDAILSQLPEVRIIHGYGMGKLRKAIAELLKDHPHVARSHSESQERGGDAVTIAVLKTL
ncbi:Smr/MutS family protein [bacterium]|nr:Smr/MutS family protein [bacterium]